MVPLLAVCRDEDATRIDWAHDSAWRFMPPVRDELGGFLMHEIDLAINKTLALAGRDEPRDYVDILYIHDPHSAACAARPSERTPVSRHSRCWNS